MTTNSTTRAPRMSEARRTAILAAYTRHAARFDTIAARHQERPPEPLPPVTAPCTTEPSARMIEVLALIADGHSNSAIGQMLLISVETVKSHARNLNALLGARNRAHSVALGFDRGLLPLPRPLSS